MVEGSQTEVTAVDIDSMDPDELEALDNNNPEPEEDTEPEIQESDEPEGEEADPEKQDSPDDNKPEEEKTEDNHKQPPEKKFSEMSPDEKIDHLQNRISNLQSGFTKERAEKRELERKLQDAKLEKLQQPGDDESEFIEMDEDEYNQLPDYAKEEYDKEKKEHESKSVQTSDDLITAVKQAQDTEIIDFIKEAFEMDIDTSIPIAEQPAEFKDIDKQISGISQYLAARQIPRLGGSGKAKYYTAEQLMDAHKLINFDDILAREKAKGAEIAATNIERAKKGGSSFDRHPSSAGNPKGQRSTKDKSLTAAEIDAMGEDELDSLANN